MCARSSLWITIAALSVVSPAEAVDASQPTPAGDPGSWILPGDYPFEALRAHASGKTGFRLDIDETGSVLGCSVTQSSGSAPLDDATCTLLKQRAHFAPAKDQQGRGINGEYMSSVSWSLPETSVSVPSDWLSYTDYPAEAVRRHWQGTSAFELDISLEGKITGCRITQTSGHALLDTTACNLMRKRAKFAPAHRDGQPVASTFNSSINWRLPS